MRIPGLLFLSSTLLVEALAGLPDLLYEKGISFVTPEDDNYQNVTTAYNLRFTLDPTIVTFPTNSSQVSEIVKIGSSFDHSIVARSGGHSYIANGLGGKNGSIVVDLRALKEITINTKSNTARVGTGNRVGDIALALGAHDRAIPHGTCPYIGIGGHAAHGGWGFPSRMWGLTLDNIISVDLVLPNGSLVKVSENAHPELFWAVRGAASSFGIATSIEFKTHQVPPSGLVFTYQWVLDVANATNALDLFQKFVQTDIPPELGLMLYFFPGAPKGTVLFGLTGGWYGKLEDVNATLDPFVSGMPLPANIIEQTGTFVESLQFEGGGFVTNLNTSAAPDTHDTFYAKSVMTPDDKVMSKESWEALMGYLANEGNATSLSWAVEIEVYGGTNSMVNSVPRDETAFVNRGSLFTFQLYASSSNREPPYPQEGFDFLEGMANSIIDNNPSDWDYGAYPNYVDDRLVDWQKRYYGSHYPKLQAIKSVIDPSNVYSFPTSIELQ